MIDLTQAKNLQTAIIKRLMTPKQYEKFLLEYETHKQSRGRVSKLERSLTRQRVILVKDYLYSPLSSKELARLHGVSVGSVYNKAGQIALSILFQDKELIQRLINQYLPEKMEGVKQVGE